METVLDRQGVAQRGKRLEYFTIGWNPLEGLVAVVAAVLAGSISLSGFGIDGFIEVTNGTLLLWRMSVDADTLKRERNEMLSLRIVGIRTSCTHKEAMAELREDTQRAFESRLGQRMLSEMVARARS